MANHTVIIGAEQTKPHVICERLEEQYQHVYLDKTFVSIKFTNITDHLTNYVFEYERMYNTVHETFSNTAFSTVNRHHILQFIISHITNELYLHMKRFFVYLKKINFVLNYITYDSLYLFMYNDPLLRNIIVYYEDYLKYANYVIRHVSQTPKRIIITRSSNVVQMAINKNNSWEYELHDEIIFQVLNNFVCDMASKVLHIPTINCNDYFENGQLNYDALIEHCLL